MRDQDWAIISKLHSEKNITKTADLVFMTQPALTKRIQQIEEELGIALVTRSSKGVVFTPEGEYVAQKTEKIIRLFDELKHHLSVISGGKKGVLKIGVPNSYCRLVLPHIIKEYNKLYSNVRFDISTSLSHEILKMVENYDVNVGFVRGEFSTGLEQILISIDQIHIVSKEPVVLEELPRLPQIDFAKEPTIVEATEKWWNEYYDDPPDILMRVNHADTCRAMIVEGLGYGIFPDVGYANNMDKLVTIPLTHKDGSKFVRKTRLVYHREDMENPLVKNFVNFIKDHGV
jgi:DNA-binding transcriptional LysR family regulator